LCRCGAPLRVYNVSKTGERLAYGHRLIDEILEDPACPKQLFILYDVNCQFSKYLKSRMDRSEYAKLKFGIGIFHVYAHEYACRLFYSPRVLVGIGWIDGEICERFWCWIMHLIAPNRSSSFYTRLQTLTHAAIEIGEARFLAMGKVLCQMLANAFILKQEAEEALTTLQEHGITLEIIKDQHEKMKDWFRERKAAASVDRLEDLFRYLRAFYKLRNSLRELLTIGEKELETLERRVDELTGRVDEDAELQGYGLYHKIARLLQKNNESKDDWMTPEGEPGSKYLHFEKNHRLTEARQVKAEFWEHRVLRTLQSENLHRRRQGLSLAHSSNL
jgi:Kyakuja-Dileera-Zisupton transposase